MAVRNFKGVTPTLGKAVYIDELALVMGDVQLGDDCSVWPTAVVRGDMHRIRVGARCSIQDGSVLHITHAGIHTGDGFPLTIGNDVTIGHNAVLHGCTIEDQVLIGIGAIVLDGAFIEKNVYIGAGSVVAPGKRLKSGFLYTGTPAVEKRPLKDQELEWLTYSAQNYVKLKNDMLASHTASYG